MKVISGLGNPGNEYNFTRHNFGFLSLDFYEKIRGFTWKEDKKYRVLYFKDGETLFIKPQTFYNDVGQSFELIRNYYKLEPKDFLIICDDFNFPFGEVRFRERGTAGGNNGLKSLVSHFGTEDFPRLRVGTANDSVRSQVGDVDFVLSRFNDSEHEKLPKILREIEEFIAKY